MSLHDLLLTPFWLPSLYPISLLWFLRLKKMLSPPQLHNLRVLRLHLRSHRLFTLQLRLQHHLRFLQMKLLATLLTRELLLRLSKKKFLLAMLTWTIFHLLRPTFLWRSLLLTKEFLLREHLPSLLRLLQKLLWYAFLLLLFFFPYE